VLAIYENKVLDELVIYGSSRLGSYNGKTSEGKRTLGNKKYELSNHLGNVLSVISDNKLGIDSDANFIADYYEPLVISESDYYPFGMAMKERSFSNEEYRFGFNTQEKTPEIGEDTYTAEFWEYSATIARRWNVDPIIKSYESSYLVFGGNPIWAVDLNGMDSLKVVSGSMDANGKKFSEGGDRNNPMFLFMAYLDNGSNEVRQMTWSEFDRDFQSMGKNISMSLNGENVVMRQFAQFIYSNSDKEKLKKAVHMTSVNDIGKFIRMGDKYSSGNLISMEGMVYKYWFHDKKMDYKSKVAEGNVATYIEGVGFFSSDVIGNIAYGWAWGGHYSFAKIAGIGDFGQFNQRFRLESGTVTEVDAIDDIYDSYTIAIGWIMRKQYNSQVEEGFRNLSSIVDSFSKNSSHSSFLWDDSSTNIYQIEYKLNGKKYRELHKVNVE
jgi:hypothetical protein